MSKVILMLTIASTVPNTEAEGPGNRFAIWVQGCPFRCPGCCNPQYLLFEESERTQKVAPKKLAEEIISHKSEIEGVTFIGGEPFSQAAGLAEVATIVRQEDLSVMIFSGFTLEELNDAQADEYQARQTLLEQTDLLVDGPYLREQHVNNRRWIGSANQQIHFLTDRYQHLEENWPSESNTIEIRLKNGEITINGFPHQDITKQSARLLRKKT